MAAAQWSYYEGGWHPYRSEQAALLEACFADPTRTHVDLDLGPRRQYRIDLQRMEQTNVHTKFTRPIARSAQDAGGQWEWQENDGSWQPYGPHVCGQLAAARRAGRTSTTFFIMSRHHANAYVVRWQPDGTGTQTNTATSISRPIRYPAGAPPLARVASGAGGVMAAAAGAAAKAAGAVVAAAGAAAKAVGGKAPAGPPSLEPLSFNADAVKLDAASLAKITRWKVLQPGEWKDGDLDPVMFSALGEDDETVVRLPCHTDAISCTFNVSTVESAFLGNPRCPSCSQQYALPGVQPTGTMQLRLQRNDCQGHPDCGTIVLHYSFPSGTQGPRHPSPGTPYQGTNRTAYYPHNPTGWQCVELLRLAFEQGQLFCIGQSVTTGRDNVVVWAGIHQKTNQHGGQPNHGWPDDTVLDRLKSECASKGLMVP